MPIHDWNRVEAGMYHDFHNAWITELRNTLNGGLLPRDYYALGEQHLGKIVADILTLHSGGSHADVNGDSNGTSNGTSNGAVVPTSSGGGLAIAEVAPKVRRHLTGMGTYAKRRRTLAIRHVSGHRLIAMIEIVSPANKDRSDSVRTFVSKTINALDLNIHVMLIDLIPPGAHDPNGIHGVIWHELDELPDELTPDEPLTLASYRAGPPVEAYLENCAIGATLPDMPLFLSNERYINVPLEATYQAAYRGVPAYWRDVLEGRR